MHQAEQGCTGKGCIGVLLFISIWVWSALLAFVIWTGINIHRSHGDVVGFAVCLSLMVVICCGCCVDMCCEVCRNPESVAADADQVVVPNPPADPDAVVPVTPVVAVTPVDVVDPVKPTNGFADQVDV
jgi:hypothetical protein